MRVGVLEISALSLALSAVVSCQHSPREGGGEPSGGAAEVGESESGGPGEGDSEGEGGSDSTGNTKFDQMVPDLEGCRKVDFLFVIDNSWSMLGVHENLISAFPNFVSAVTEDLGGIDDFHIMVTDTDAWNFQACVDAWCLPEYGGNCVKAWNDFECGVTEPLECEDVLGAGIRFPRGNEAANMDCGFSSGGRYIDASEPDVNAAFGCAASRAHAPPTDVPELPMDSMLAAVSDELAQPGACNDGFLRDDAILVVAFFTDESDDEGDGSSGDPISWRDDLIAAKGGDQEAVVVIGFTGDNDHPDPLCNHPAFNIPPAALPSPRSEEFVELFDDHGTWGSICGDLGAVLGEAIAPIVDACEDFDPAG